MTFLYLGLLIIITLFFYGYFGEVKSKSAGFILGFGLAFRLVLAPVVYGFPSDMGCWLSWSDTLAKDGIFSFYKNVSFCDYPPLYMYFLYGIGKIRQAFNFGEVFDILLVKSPSIIADIVCAYLLYTIAKRHENKKAGVLACLIYALNPAIFINSAVWGQIDSLFSLFLVSSLYFLYLEKYKPSAAVFALATLLKPQALIFTPVFLYMYIEKLYYDKEKKSYYNREFLSSVGIFLALFFGISAPFFGKDILGIIRLYASTMSSYPYASVNAFNLYSLFGANFEELDYRFLFLTYRLWGIIFIVLTVISGFWFFCKAKGERSKIFYTGAIIITSVFTLAVKMHERYLFPSILLLLISYVITNNKKVLIPAFWISFAHYFNVFYVLRAYLTDDYNILPDNPYLGYGSIFTIFAFAVLIYMGISVYIREFPKVLPPLSFKKQKSQKGDFVKVAALTLIYALISFFNLGNTYAPQTYHDFSKNPIIVVDLKDVHDFGGIMYYKGLGDGRIKIETSLSGFIFNPYHEFDTNYCFTYTKEANGVVGARFIKITSLDNIEMMEIGILDKDGNYIKVESPYLCFDEQEYLPKYPSYKNSMYFDEIYHARTAYEHLRGLEPYENTHPPLGKLLIAACIKIFGMTPFGWRFAGNLCGIIMVPVMFLLGKKIFKRTGLAYLCAFFTAFDGLHFTQTRIATIDSFPVLFILLSYYFMYDFYEGADRKNVVLPLFLSGIFIGLAASAKWIGFYSYLGLFVLFVIGMVKRYFDNKSGYFKFAAKMLFAGFAFFILIPFLIYFASFFTTLSLPHNDLSSFMNYQTHMFYYHKDLVAEHPYSSPWWQWPVMAKPVFYYSMPQEFRPEGLVSSISGIGNPLIWWAAFPSVIFLIYLLFKKAKDGRALFIVIGYLSQLLPWMLVPRLTFMYHYFASFMFSILALSYLCGYISERQKNGIKFVNNYKIYVIIFFAMYYPVMSGAFIFKDYVSIILCAFSTWGLYT